MKPHNTTTETGTGIPLALTCAWSFLCLGFLILSILPPYQRPETDLVQSYLVAPLDGAALNKIAIQAQGKGEKSFADQLFALSAARSFRDIDAQSHVIDQLLSRGEIAVALRHIDAVLRAKPAPVEKFYDVLFALAQRPEGLKPLVALLASNPPWRQNFFKFAGADAKGQDAAYLILAELRARGLTIVDGEIRGVLKNLIAQKNVEKAYFIWLDLLSAKQLRDVKLLYNGDFTQALQNFYFDWTIRDVRGVSVSLVMRGPGQSDQALQVAFAQSRPAENLIEQHLMLPAGEYVLQAAVNAKELRSEHILQWQLRCAEKTSAIGTIDSSIDSSGWVEVESVFTVPEQDCAYQKLVLRFSKPSKASGKIFFDKFRIMRKS